MKLYLANIGGITGRHALMISPERAEKARRYRFEADRKRCEAGGLLLKKYLGDTPIYTDGFGKPRAESGVCFNLSHSGDWVALVLGEDEVGCDVERLRQADALRLGKIVFTENELRLISDSPDRLGVFYRIWTKKEALLKCMGKGFHRSAKTVDVSGGSFFEDRDVYNISTQVFADYTISVCAKNAEAEFETEVVSFD